MAGKTRSGPLARAGALVLLGAGRAAAQDEAVPPPDPPRIEVSGFVDAYYGYVFNRADPAFRAFDIQHNTFALSLAEIAFAKAAAPGSRVGFRVDVDLGEVADVVAALEPEGDGDELDRHLQQAYVSLLTNKVTWDAGRFVTPIGAEVVESQDNWNYTRSILFGYAIPVSHTGVRASYAPTAKASFAGYVLNGWTARSEVNGAKTVALNATLKPTPKASWAVNYMGGREGDADPPTRHLFDTTASYSISDRLSVMANLDYGREGGLRWWGVAAYGRFQVLPSWTVAGRVEHVDDTAGGFMLLGTTGQSLTLTSDHVIAGALRARLEPRLDVADEAIFPRRDGTAKKTQASLTVGLVVTFGGKL